MIIVFKIRRRYCFFHFRSKSSAMNHMKKNSERSTDVILGADKQWSYDSMKSDTGRAIMIYGPADDLFTRTPITVTPSSLRSLPRRPNTFVGGPSSVKNTKLRQSATTLRFHGAPDGYCTVGRMYEEIPVRRSDSETIFEDINAMHERQVSNEHLS
ncbi:unnamed protein product [Anisakis simplex]|uniref:Uncharacterized protein n=1 Tax=Anisakis simplex TaxID=6269 RepID=A0A0M3KBP7_ANISI|nr:unnamed protein product [Anisakis simplex]